MNYRNRRKVLKLDIDTWDGGRKNLCISKLRSM